MNPKWKTLASKDLFTCKYFKVRSEKCQNSEGQIVDDYYLIDAMNWVNVVPVTEEGHIVLIEQYRHGAGKVLLEVPGGMVDGAEDPKRAALRELEEETGYVPSELQLAGCHYPNPALQTNQMFTYVAFGCRKEKELALEPFEDIQVVVKSVPEVLELVRNGEFVHSIVLASLFRALPFLGCHYS